jgi:hypothetical protein
MAVWSALRLGGRSGPLGRGYRTRVLLPAVLSAIANLLPAWLDQRMGIKLGKNGKLPGENLIGVGIMLCALSFAFYVITAMNGVPNGLIFSGGGVLGLLIICVGYLKRIAAALMPAADITAAEPVAKP